jgi:hypothetical protein
MNAFQQNTTGPENTAIGAFALTANTTGEDNTACGAGALQRNTTGFGNTASGRGALQNNTEGYGNIGIGRFSLNDNTTGDRNTALGDFAGRNNTIGSDSIFIGNNGLANDSQTIKIGTQETQLTTFIAGIAGTPVTGSAVEVTASGQLGVSSSSARFKDEIETLADVGERLAALRPVTFR